MRSLRSSRLIAGVAVVLFASAGTASALSNLCTGNGKIQGGGQIGYSDNAPFGNFHSWSWEVRTPDMIQTLVIPGMVAKENTAPLKPGANVPNVDNEKDFYAPQVGLIWKPETCEFTNMVYGGGYKEVTKPWNGQCDHTTLTIVCHAKNASTGSSKDCDKVMSDYIAENPLEYNQARYYGWIQTCVGMKKPPEVEVANPENTDSSYSLTIQKPKLPAYERDGMSLDKATDDFTGKFR